MINYSVHLSLPLQVSLKSFNIEKKIGGVGIWYDLIAGH